MRRARISVCAVASFVILAGGAKAPQPVPLLWRDPGQDADGFAARLVEKVRELQTSIEISRR